MLFINISGRLWASADKRQHNNKKKKEQADQDRKYDSLRISYLGNTSDEWERKRTIIREISFAVCRAGKGRHRHQLQACGTPPPVCCGLFDLYQVHDAPIIIMDYDM